MEKQIEKPVLVFLGPTASGKTALSVAVAKALNAEIISADSRQLYRGMDIGTGKDLVLYGQISYHLIDICEAGEKYNLSRFQADFEQVTNEILAKNKVPILCGGTGLYLQAVIQGFEQLEIPADEFLRKQLEELSEKELLDKYQSFDKKPENVDLSTRKRRIRAIEKAIYLTNNPQLIVEKKHRKFKFAIFGLNPDVEIRRKNISLRLKERLENGLIDEVERLLKAGLSHEVLQYYGLEYKYVSLFLLGELTKNDMETKLETEIHRYAKRQMTFFRSMESKGIKINWLPENLSQEAKVEYILKQIEY
jgi:tRNA dimethylallyltransferase